MRSNTAIATTATAEARPYVGRFAPTPSGELHLGSLYTAAASFLDARAHGGRWLLRLEDLDRPREVAGAADSILRTLEAFGFEWHGAVLRQRDRIAMYAAALERLRADGATFQCSCSRSRLEDAPRYPGTCRARSTAAASPAATRLRIDAVRIEFSDRIQGHFVQDVAAEVGDVILLRRDQIFAYLLTVVIDDEAQGVTHVVRGADLLDNTPRQIYVQRQLRFESPQYAHVPLLTEVGGEKLSKSRRHIAAATGAALPQLLSVFSLLGLAPPAELAAADIAAAWRWAMAAWNVNNVPKRPKLPITG